MGARVFRTLALAKLVEKIKTRGPEFSGFSWQNGHGAFSIGVSNLPALER